VVKSAFLLLFPPPSLPYTKVDNSRDTVFVPHPAGKPSYAPAGVVGDNYPHPYETEIRNFTLLPSQLTPLPHSEIKSRKPLAIESSPSVVVVDSREKLVAMVNRVRGELEEEVNEGGGGGEKKIAVDLEAHSIRSFQGMVCLMQVSTTTTDYLIDTLVLRQEIGELLSDLFSDHTIIKVFHGAESDIKWLQRDFGIYVINLFDTYYASKRLSYPNYSLAYLLEKHCGVKADKMYQLADWRVRPLPDDMVKYAREDTHYLLYIYEVVKGELVAEGGKEAVVGVLEDSRQLCLQKYKKEGEEEEEEEG